MSLLQGCRFALHGLLWRWRQMPASDPRDDLDCLPLALVRLDETGRMSRLSNGWERLSGHRCGDCLSRRLVDFIHIEDIIKAVMTAVENDVRGPINLGWGRATSFLQLAEMVTYYAGYHTEIVTRPDKPVGCMHRVSDSSKMWSFYVPKITLEEGIERAIRGKR